MSMSFQAEKAIQDLERLEPSGRQSHRSWSLRLIGAAALTLAAGLWSPAFGQQEVVKAPKEALPPGVEQLLPRGRIAAINSPTFVAAKDAEIADDGWVLGIEIDGIAKAYSLNLLNRHEVVNDRFGDLPVAAVW